MANTYTFDNVPAESELVAGDFLIPAEDDNSKVWVYVENYGWAAYSGDADEILLRSQLAATGGASLVNFGTVGDTENATGIDLANEVNALIDKSGRALGTINIDAFGADSDFATALEEALSYSEANGGKVVGTPGKTYFSRRQVALTDPSFIEIDLSMSKIIRATDFSTHEAAPTNPYSAAPILLLDYQHTNTTTLSGPITTTEIDFTGSSEGNTTCTRLPVLNTSGYSAGDHVRVFSDDAIPWGTGIDDEYLGQDAVVARVNTNTSLDLYGKIDLHNYLLTNVRVAKKTNLPLTLSINCSDPDGYYDDPSTEEKYRRNRAMVRITGAVSPLFPRLVFSKCMSMGLETNACFKPVVNELDCEYLRTSSDYFAVGYGWQSRDTYPTLLTPINGRRVRHMITSNAEGLSLLTTYLSSGGAYPTYEPEQYGGSVCGMVIGGNLRGGEHAPYDTHADAYRWTFINPTSGVQIRGPSAGQSCVQLRGEGHIVTGLNASGGGGVSIIPTGTASYFEISGTYRRPIGVTTSNYAIGVSDNGLSTKPLVRLNMDIIASDGTGPLINITNCECDFKGSVLWKYGGSSSARIFSLTKSNLNADFDLDTRGNSGTNLRIVKFEDGLSSAKYKAKVKADTSFVAAEFSNNAASCVADIDTPSMYAGQVSSIAFANSANAKKKVLRVDERTISNVTYTTSGNKTITYTNLNESITNVLLAATVTGAAINSVPIPFTSGQTLILSNTKSGGLESITINDVPGLLELGGSNISVAVGGSLQLTGNPVTGVWSVS